MIHPFMPFLSEELWQRLPRRKSDRTPFITIAAYPEWNRLFDDSAAEAEYGLLVDISKAFDPHDARLAPSIRSLVGKAMREVSDLTILSISEAAPIGSAVYTVDSVATVFFDIKGHVDIDIEMQKALGSVNNQKVMAVQTTWTRERCCRGR
jgi:valyl-tRNA synthetase